MPGQQLTYIIHLSGLDPYQRTIEDKIIEIPHDDLVPKEYRAVRDSLPDLA